MAAAYEPVGRTTIEESGPARWFRWLSWLTAILVLVQAVLAGRGWFIDLDLIETHGVVGNLTFLVVIAQVVFAFLARRRGRLGGTELGLSVLLLILLIAQLGLGYAGRESESAASLHVPNGVLIFGVSAALLALASRWRPASAG